MKRKLSLLLVIFLLLLFPFGLFVGTEWGLRLAVHLGQSLSGGLVTVGDTKGRLGSNYTLENVVVATSSVDVRVGSFSLDWKPFSLLRGRLEIVSLGIDSVSVELQSQEQEKEEVEAEPFSLPPLILPVRVVLHELSLEDFQIGSKDSEDPFRIDTFNTSFELESEKITVNSFSLEGPEIGLEFHGNAILDRSPKLDLLGDWKLSGFGFHPSRGTFSLRGPFEKLGVNAALNDPGEIQVKGVIHNLLEEPNWVAEVTARNVNLETWIEHCPAIILTHVNGDMHGDFGHYLGDVYAEGYWGVADNLQLNANIDGDAWGIIFNSLRIDRQNSSAVAENGSISWEEVFSWEADLDFDDFLLSMFFPDFDGSVSSTFHSIGDVTEDGELIASFALKTTEGKFGEYQVSASGNIGLTENYIFSEDLVLRSDLVGGQARIRKVKFSWENELTWDTDLQLVDFNPGFLHPEAVGKISGDLISSLQWQGETPVGKLEIITLGGEMRGTALSGNGAVALDENGLSSSGLELMLGESLLHIQGRVDDDFGLDVEFTSPDLSQLGAGLEGNLSAYSQIRGSREEPIIELSAAGQNIVTGKVAASKLDGTLLLTAGEGGAIEGKVSVTDSSMGDYNVSLVDVSVDGKIAEHTIQGSLETELGALSFAATGGYDERWLGTFSSLELLLQEYGSWTLQQQAALELSVNGLQLDDFCLTNIDHDNSGSVCLFLEGSVGEASSWSVAGRFDRFALQPISEMDLGLPPLNGSLDGTFDVRGDAESVVKADTLFKIAEVDTLLAVTDDELISFQLRDGVLRTKLLDNKLLFGLSVETSEDGSLDFTGSINNFGDFGTPLSENALSASIELERYHLKSLAALTGFGVEPTGWVSSSLRVAGTLLQPEVYGELEIQEGGIELPYQGVSLKDVQLSVNSRDSGALVRASASSGGGHLNAEGYITRGDDGLETSLKLRGENFLLVNLPEYSFRVNPDAGIKVSSNRAYINGDLFVPSGLIAPEELKEAVRVSEDVVYLGEAKAHEKKAYPVELDLNVRLGDEVEVDGYGLKGRLGGQLNVKVTPEEFITGRGELDLLDATFTFYGRSLDIERGRMLFTGGPIDNPGVDIRAQKTVTPETARDDGYTVGVDINGLVQDLQFHLFSDPYMEDTDILSQMVVGHSFASSSEEEGNLLQAAAVTLGLAGSSRLMKGIGDLILIDDLHLEGSSKDEDVSLVVGKRITEDLYIGYDMNMYSQLGQFRVRYDLKRGFYVETRSSSESTGADLIYSFER